MRHDDIRLVGLDNVEPYKLNTSTGLYALEPPEMLIDDVLPKGTITALTSPPNTGKTWFALDAGRAVLTGGLFLNKFRAQKGAVLFVGSDASEADYARQYRRLTAMQWASLNPTEEEIAAGHWEPNPFDTNIRFLLQSSFMLDNLDSVRKMLVTSRNFEWGEDSRHFRLIIFDTYSKMTRGNQNDNTLTEEVFRNMRLITEFTGAAILVLHHNGHIGEYNDGKRWRGADAATGALDNHIHLERSKKEKYIIECSFEKFRGITPPTFFYEMDVNGDDMSPAVLSVIEQTEEKTGTLSDAVTEDIIGWMQTAARGQQVSVNQIAAGLFPSMGTVVGSEKKLRSIVYNRLATELQKLKPRVMKERLTGGRVMYLALTQEDAVEDAE